jgi:hypothetical protein
MSTGDTSRSWCRGTQVSYASRRPGTHPNDAKRKETLGPRHWKINPAWHCHPVGIEAGRVEGICGVLRGGRHLVAEAILTGGEPELCGRPVEVVLEPVVGVRAAAELGVIVRCHQWGCRSAARYAVRAACNRVPAYARSLLRNSRAALVCGRVSPPVMP